jgi:hypothetical protein
MEHSDSEIRHCFEAVRAAATLRHGGAPSINQNGFVSVDAGLRDCFLHATGPREDATHTKKEEIHPC